jgi:hypothetical protein
MPGFEKSFGASPERKESPADEYGLLLQHYRESQEALKRLEAKRAIGEDVSRKVVDADKKRHEIHLKLLKSGETLLGKDKADVLVDIIRMERTLESYGLPEFSILKAGDVIATGDEHNPYYFNVDGKERAPAKDAFEGWKRGMGESVIPDEKFMLVFAIVPIDHMKHGDPEDRPADYDVRLGRAKALADEIGCEVFEESDSAYHDASAKILGVMIPNADLEKAAGVIRDNPTKYRLGEEFYSEEEKTKMRKED